MSSLRTLLFSVDNPCNAVLTDETTGEDVYTIRTEHNKETTTFVHDENETLVASWQWHDVRSDVISFGTSKPIPSSTWLRKSIIPFVDTVTFKGPDGATYKWKGTSPGSRIELYAENDSKHPLATFRRSVSIQDRTVNPPVPKYTPAKLLIDPRGQAIQNLIIISFLLIERRRRESEASSKSMADSLAAVAKISKS